MIRRLPVTVPSGFLGAGKTTLPHLVSGLNAVEGQTLATGAVDCLMLLVKEPWE